MAALRFLLAGNRFVSIGSGLLLLLRGLRAQGSVAPVLQGWLHRFGFALCAAGICGLFVHVAAHFLFADLGLSFDELVWPGLPNAVAW